MQLSRLVLFHFRNRSHEVMDLSPHLTVIVGENARGKTNLLEAIYFLINGVGFRESKEEELVQMGSKEASVEGRFENDDQQFDYKIHLGNIEGKVTKSFFVQKTKKGHRYYLQEQTRAVLFTPEQIEIINGSPDIRRGYINKLLSFYDPEYRLRLINLESALRRRNKVLEQFRDESRLREELKFWNTYVEEQARYITDKREEYVQFLNSHTELDSKSFSIVYKKNEATKERFEEYFKRETYIRKTAIGPQKDDFQIFMKGDFEKSVHHYGSRSEQRLAVFWLKVNEINYYESAFKKKPIILLDDVFSEFDHHNKLLILELIKKYQTVLTTTEEEVIDLVDIPRKTIKV